MEYTEIMVRYGELSTKGKNRKDFIARLGGNIRKSLKDFEQVVVHPNRDRTHVKSWKINGSCSRRRASNDERTVKAPDDF